MAVDIRDVLCRKWALEILRFLNSEGAQNYSQIETAFETSSDIITDRLQQLTSSGLISRDEKSAKDVRYSITDDGEKTLQLLNEIHRLLD